MNSAFFYATFHWTVVSLHVETENFPLRFFRLSQRGWILDSLIFNFHRRTKVICFGTASLHLNVWGFLTLTDRGLIVCTGVRYRIHSGQVVLKNSFFCFIYNSARSWLFAAYVLSLRDKVVQVYTCTTRVDDGSFLCRKFSLLSLGLNRRCQATWASWINISVVLVDIIELSWLLNLTVTQIKLQLWQRF